MREPGNLSGKKSQSYLRQSTGRAVEIWLLHDPKAWPPWLVIAIAEHPRLGVSIGKNRITNQWYVYSLTPQWLVLALYLMASNHRNVCQEPVEPFGHFHELLCVFLHLVWSLESTPHSGLGLARQFVWRALRAQLYRHHQDLCYMAVHIRLYSLTLLSSFSPCTASKKQEEEGKQKDH
jgi:hypothetical protein